MCLVLEQREGEGTVSGWLKHGKWPTWMKGLHYYTIFSFIALMVTGLALDVPVVHAVLIPYLRILYDVHVTLGLVFAATLLTPVLVRFPAGKVLRSWDWLFPLLFGAAIVLTGILVWQVALFPTSWRSRAFHWHSWTSYILTAWLLIHAVYKTAGYRPPADGPNARVDPSRRMFLKWLGTGLAGTVVLTVVDPVAILRKVLPCGGGEAPAAPSQFDYFYTVTGGYPSVDLATYRLKVDGLVTRPTTLRWKHIMALKSSEELTDFHCVTGWSVANVHWKGLHLKTLADLVQPLPQVKYVHFYSFDGAYTESLSLSEAFDSTVLLAESLDGKPLTAKEGAPLRLVVPKMYGYKSIKWVNRVEFSNKPLTGYWEARGYPGEAYLPARL